MTERLNKISRTLITGLRHKPLAIFKKELSYDGFIDIATIIDSFDITRQELQLIVDTNNKNRFEIVGTNIRARQGHSIDVDLELVETEPPSLLFHGTVASSEKMIYINGIQRMSRHHVHLSEDVNVASDVGFRRVKINDPLALLMVDSSRMFKDGYKFYKTSNGVWLTDFVPPDYVETLE